MKVRAIGQNAEGSPVGYVGLKRRYEGDVFDVSEKEFSAKWMERVDGKPAPKKAAPAPVVKPGKSKDVI